MADNPLIGTPFAPSIDPVQQITLEPLRPSATWYWVGGVVLALGVVVGGLLFAKGIFDFIGQIDDFHRVEVGESDIFQLDEGDWVIYHEPGFAGGANRALDVEVAAVPDGIPLQIRTSSFDQTYSDGSVDGFSVGEFSVDRAGPYRVTVAEPEFATSGQGAVAVGRPLFDRLIPWLLASIGVGSFGVLAGLVILIVVAVQRGRAKRRRMPPLPPPGYPTAYPHAAGPVPVGGLPPPPVPGSWAPAPTSGTWPPTPPPPPPSSPPPPPGWSPPGPDPLP